MANETIPANSGSGSGAATPGPPAVDPSVGLTSEQVTQRRQQYGENAFKRHKLNSWLVLLHQFQSSLTYLLLAASVLSFYLRDINDGTVILAILLLNAVIGFSQEYRSEKTVERLAKLVSHSVLVKRDGKTTLVEQTQLVPGDVVCLKLGDIVPADAAVFESEDLSVDESQLTGESAAVFKGLDPGADKRGNLLFMGSVIVKGQGQAVVGAIGDKTELGKIANLSSTTNKVTQYEHSLQAFSSFLIKLTLLTLSLVFIAKVGLDHGLAQASGSLLFIIALAIAVVPEAMPVIATVTMAKGADGLSKQHVVVKQLSAMNDLGNITVLCTDKTGTLTENILQIVGISSGDTLKLLAFALASNEGVDEKSKQLVSSFDQAFQSYATADARTEAAHFKKIKELPFDPNDRKRRAILQDQRDNSYYLVNIGSAETLLAASSSDRHDQYAQEIVTDGLTGLRHLAFSYAKIDYGDHFDIAANETNLQFLGFAKMVDPLRPSTKETLDKAKKLGISIKILTGDSKEVAEYVGREVGLLGEGSRVYTGEEIEKMSDDELRKILPTTSIFAKVTPTQKYAIIKLLKEKDVVGYQGDGINDAPSLKLADVGIAVNNASDVAKDSADILLLNPDLGVIINGIRFGRTIFVNINKYITYTMVGNFGNFFALAGLFLVSATLPLLAVQLLLSSLITDFPLVAIATDSVNDSEVLGPSKFDIHKLMLISLVLGGVTTLVEFMFFAHFRLSATPRTNTLIFLFLTLIQLAVIICVRSKGYFWTAKRPSWQLTAGILTVTAISVLAPYVTPIAHIFSFVPLPPLLIAEVLVITLAYVALMDTIKVWFYQATAVHAAH